jgi:hypothetical protein
MRRIASISRESPHSWEFELSRKSKEWSCVVDGVNQLRSGIVGRISLTALPGKGSGAETLPAAKSVLFSEKSKLDRNGLSTDLFDTNNDGQIDARDVIAHYILFTKQIEEQRKTEDKSDIPETLRQRYEKIYEAQAAIVNGTGESEADEPEAKKEPEKEEPDKHVDVSA